MKIPTKISESRKQELLGELLAMSRNNLANCRLPITALLASETEVFSRGYSDTGGALDHAELNCVLNSGLSSAPRDAVLLSTVEPCIMCLGAARNFGIETIFFVCEAYQDGASWCLHLGTNSMSFKQLLARSHFMKDLKLHQFGSDRRQDFIRCFEDYLELSPLPELGGYAKGILEQEYGAS